MTYEGIFDPSRHRTQRGVIAGYLKALRRRGREIP